LCVGRKHDLYAGAVIFLAGAGLSKDVGYGDWLDLVRPAAQDLGLNADTTPPIDILQFRLVGDRSGSARVEMMPNSTHLRGIKSANAQTCAPSQSQDRPNLDNKLRRFDRRCSQ
jgi:hypothetical protein